MTPGHNAYDTGWLAVQRTLRNHPVVGFGQPVKPQNKKKGAYSRCEAWLDILFTASYQASKFRWSDHDYEIDAGDLVASHGFLAKRWNWTIKTVRGFLNLLVKHDMLKKGALEGALEGALPGALDGTPKGALKKPTKKKAPGRLSVINWAKHQVFQNADYDDFQHQRGALGGVPDDALRDPLDGQLKGRNLTSTKQGIINARAREAAPKNQNQSWAEIIANERGETPEATGVSLQGETVVLMNGTRQKWIELFGDDEKRLDLALIEISAELQPNSGKPLHIDVESRLAKRAAWKRDGDKRYQRRTEPKTKSKNSKPAKKPTAEQMRIWAGAEK